MRRKKVISAVTINNEPTQVEALHTEGVIDLDSAEPVTAVPFDQCISDSHLPKAKRKYTRRASKKVESDSVTPIRSFVDVDAIRSARIQAFVDYIDEDIMFETATQIDIDLKRLLNAAAEITLETLAQKHAEASGKITHG